MMEVIMSDRHISFIGITSAAFLFFTQGLFATFHNTQIDAHINKFGNEIHTRFGLNPYEDPIIQEMAKSARMHSHSHYELYHAQQGKYRIIQDIYKWLKEFFEVTSFGKQFTFLRFDDPIFSQYTNIKDFLNKKLKEKQHINDMESDVFLFLLSANLSPFGNFDIPGESTYNYYLKNHSEHDVSFSLLNKICTSFGLPNHYINKLNELVEKTHYDQGTLFQILIPKSIIDHIGYKSFSYGTPFYNAWCFRDQADRLYYQELSPLSCQQVISSLFNDKFILSMALEMYRTQPHLLHNMNSIQARLLLSNNYLLNPKSGILINRFTHLNNQQVKVYEKELQRIIDEILIDWLSHAINQSNIPIEQHTRIMSLLAKIKLLPSTQTSNEKSLSPEKIIQRVRSMQQTQTS